MSFEAARLVVQLALGLVFLLSTAGKLRHPGAFVRGVAEFEILPVPLAYAFGGLLIPVEAFLAAAHLSGWGLAVAVPLGTAVLLAFLVAVAISLRRNRDLLCHCFDSLGGERVSLRSVAQLLLLLSGELFLLAGAARPAGFGGPIFGGRSWSLEELALAGFWAAFCLLGGLWLLRADEVYALFRPYRCKTCSEPPAGQPAL